MKLAYRAFDKTGREVNETIDAGGAAEATEKLRQQGLFVAEILPADESHTPEVTGRRRWQSRTRRLKNLAMFARQLHVLVRSGTPLVQGLRALERQSADSAWSEIIADIRTHVENGSTLATAMQSHPECFDSVSRNMVAAGESSGKLPTVLDRLANLTRSRLHVRRTVQGAMVYPALLITVCVGVMVVLMVVVVPRFVKLFESMAIPLPPTTSALVFISTTLRTYWWVILAAIVASVAGMRYYSRTPKGRRGLDTAVLRIPQVGRMVRNFTTARISRLMGILLDSHLAIVESLKLTRNTLTNFHYSRLIQRAEEAVIRGEPISSAFYESDLVSPSMYESLRSGEQSGQVGSMLLDLADFLDEENEVALKSLTSLVEPLILILMGLVVAFVALSIFMPLFDMASLSGGGAT